MVDTRERIESAESTAETVERLAYEAAACKNLDDVDLIWDAVRQFNSRD